MTCWRRLAEWTEAGVWPRLHTQERSPPRRSAARASAPRSAFSAQTVTRTWTPRARSMTSRGSPARDSL
jgi:transposase